jgi:hypothetical protein
VALLSLSFKSVARRDAGEDKDSVPFASAMEARRVPIRRDVSRWLLCRDGKNGHCACDVILFGLDDAHEVIA